MSVAYKFDCPKLDFSKEQLELPTSYSTSNGEEYQLDNYQPEDVDQLFDIFHAVVEDGQSYPQMSVTRDQFEQYFLSQYCFVVRAVQPGESGRVVAGFYIKPNFPGRSSHLANYGLIVHLDYRGKGLGNFMVENCIRLARIVGFRALYTNLIYANNTASIKACHKNGFVQVGRVPNAGYLKDLGFTDALQFYKDLTK